jgi:Tfp pilus assembly protein PilN
MAQQINLYSPIFLAPRRYFSAHAMAASLGVFALALVAVCGWMVASGSSLRRDLAGSVQAQAAERQRLTQALAAQPAASGAALEQELAQAQRTLATRRALLDELTRGRLVEGRSHAAMLRMVAQTVPALVWLTDIRLVEGRLELRGLTLQPDALRPGLAQLAAHPLTSEQRLAAVRLERVAPGTPQGGVPGGGEAWAFQLVSQTPALDGTATAAADMAATTGARP